MCENHHSEAGDYPDGSLFRCVPPTIFLRAGPVSLLHNHMIEDRFWSKVNKDAPVPADRPELGPCWLWTGAQAYNGYGFFRAGPLVRAHRFAYEFFVGPIPEGLQIDHLCRVRNCVNPDHLEPVTGQENHRRGNSGKLERERTHCPQGHPYDEANTRWWRGRNRHCRACDRERHRRFRERAARPG